MCAFLFLSWQEVVLGEDYEEKIQIIFFYSIFFINLPVFMGKLKYTHKSLGCLAETALFPNCWCEAKNEDGNLSSLPPPHRQ